MVRVIKALILASIALFFSLAALNNCVDYSANWKFVQHVLSMDTTYKDPSLVWRAISDKEVQHFVYTSIIASEVITAIICWIASLWMLKNCRPQQVVAYNKAKKAGLLGLFLGFLLFMVGYIDLGGEWFLMWQSTHWNGQATAGLFLTIILLVMIFITMPESA